MYMQKVTILGEYKGQGSILVGGKPLLANLAQYTEVFEDEFLRLRIAEQNGWFKIHNDNYADFLKSRGRTIAPVNPIIEAPAEASIETIEETTDTPTETTDTPTETVDTPAETTDTPAETTDTPAETTDAPAAAAKPARRRAAKQTE